MCFSVTAVSDCCVSLCIALSDCCVSLCTALFVDIGDNVSVVDRVKLSYTYDDIDTSEVGGTTINPD